MNTVFNKCGTKLAASKFQLMWKSSYEKDKLIKFAIRPYTYLSSRSSIITFCRTSKLFELTFLAIKSLDQKTLRPLSASKHRCWKCNAVVTERDLVCMSCGCAQEPRQNLNHFEIFKETPNFDIDIRNLTIKFRRLQTLLHPDKFATRSKKEQEYSLEQSMQVNKAYQTLLRPMERGKYLLELHGDPFGEEDIGMPSDFLSDIMEVNETLQECESTESLETIRHINEAKLQKHFSDLSLFFKEKNFTRARESLSKLKYYVNIDNRIKKLEDDFGISRDD